MYEKPQSPGRREFFRWAGRRGVVVGLAATSLPAFLEACAREERKPVTTKPKKDEGRAIVKDVLDYELTSDEWEGEFGFVTLRLRKGNFDGKDVYFIRTDVSDQAFAEDEGLVFAPKIGALAGAGLSGAAYLVSGGVSEQGTVLSTEPGRADYTPAWRVHRVAWKRTPRLLRSVAEVEAARTAGDVTAEQTNIVLNASVVKWSNGEMEVDNERKVYLGPGQLLEPADTSGMKVTFKLHECFPGVRYIVLDHSIEPAAMMTHTVFSPRLDEGPAKAEATGRTNVFMNGLQGPGPMGFQPSVFDSEAGTPEWSPYWDHYAYKWKDGRSPRLLKTQTQIHAARDAGDLEEFPGVPDTKGKVFTVNCPVPVLAPNAFTG